MQILHAGRPVRDDNLSLPASEAYRSMELPGETLATATTASAAITQDGVEVQPCVRQSIRIASLSVCVSLCISLCLPVPLCRSLCQLLDCLHALVDLQGPRRSSRQASTGASIATNYMAIVTCTSRSSCVCGPCPIRLPRLLLHRAGVLMRSRGQRCAKSREVSRRSCAAGSASHSRPKTALAGVVLLVVVRPALLRLAPVFRLWLRLQLLLPPASPSCLELQP